MSVSESVEMYLVTIAMLEETGMTEPVPLSRLAEELSVQPVSVNQMIRKLDESGLVKYHPYKGAELTTDGRQQALHIIRHRRLWEVFFVNKLGFSPIEADALACRVEHISTDEVAARLLAFLDNPEVTPSGKPIPAADAQTLPSGQPLTTLQAGQHGEVLHLEADDSLVAFLNQQGLVPGATFQIQAVSESGVMLLHNAQGGLSLDSSLTDKVRIKLLQESEHDA